MSKLFDPAGWYCRWQGSSSLCRSASAIDTNTFMRRRRWIFGDAIFQLELAEQPALIPPLSPHHRPPSAADHRSATGITVCRRLGKRSGVPVKGLTVTNSKREAAIQRAARAGRYNLVVVGTSLRQGEARFLGPRSSALLRALRCPVLLIAQ
jgi:hypothetical protein